MGTVPPLPWKAAFFSWETKPLVIRFTMSSPDGVPRNKDSQRNKANPRGFCLFCFVLVSVKFWRGSACKWFKKHSVEQTRSCLFLNYCAAVTCAPARSESLPGDLVQDNIRRCMCASARVTRVSASSFSLLSHTALTCLTDHLALSPVDDPLVLATVPCQYTASSSVFSTAAYCSTINAP